MIQYLFLVLKLHMPFLLVKKQTQQPVLSLDALLKYAQTNFQLFCSFSLAENLWLTGILDSKPVQV